MNPQTPKELLEAWLVGVKSRLLSHFECAKRFDAGAARLGIPTVICSSVVSVISQASSDNYPHAQLLTTCISMLVTILSGLATFLQYQSLAEKHRTVANGLAVMRRDIETTLVSGDVTIDILNDYKKRWTDLDANAPSIPEHVYSRHNCRVRKEAESEDGSQV